MQVVKHGGLSGKARRNHKRGRAARLHANRLVDEYFERDLDELRSDRWIPISGRSEFLPSAVFTDEAAVSRGDQQLAPPLNRRKKADKVEQSAAAKSAIPQRAAKAATDVALRFPRTQRSASIPVLKPPEQFGRKEPFTIGGFLFGCAMGSAAAALVLLLVQTVIG